MLNQPNPSTRNGKEVNLQTLTQPTWILIKDKLPEEGQEILVFDSEFKQIAMATFEDGLLFFEEYGMTNEFERFTHWMTLPDPPQNP